MTTSTVQPQILLGCKSNGKVYTIMCAVFVWVCVRANVHGAREVYIYSWVKKTLSCI